MPKPFGQNDSVLISETKEAKKKMITMKKKTIMITMEVKGRRKGGGGQMSPLR